MSAIREIKRPLTPRQLEFLAKIAQGMTVGEIACELHLAPGYVQNYLDDARDRAGVRNVTQLVALCVAAGLIVYED